MTSLRDLFKKSKKAYPKIKKKAQETTDKILDADLEETAFKTIQATGKMTKDASIGLVKLSLWGVFIAINVFVLYVIVETFYESYWCKGKKTGIFDDPTVFKSLNKKEVRELEKQWFDKDCASYVNLIGYSDEEMEGLSWSKKFWDWKRTFEFHPKYND